MNMEEPFDHHLQQGNTQSSEKMMMIVELLSTQQPKIVYANENSTSFFSTTNTQSVERFFGSYWTSLKQAISNRTSFPDFQFITGEGKEILQLTIKLLPAASSHPLLLLEFQQNSQQSSDIQWKEKYYALLAYNTDALITLNTAGLVTFCNPMVHKLLNYLPQEITGRPFYDFVDEMDQKSFSQLWSYTKHGKTFEFPHMEVIHQKGHTLLVSLKILPVIVKGQYIETHIILRELPDYVINNSKMHYKSYHDHLTGLWNSRMLKIHFMQDSIQTAEENGKLKLLHLGIDRFKVIVESLGYSAGNQFLTMVADRLKGICTAIEKVYRNTGDEFILLVHEYKCSQADKVCEEILSAFKKPFIFEDQEYYLSISIGISTFPEHGKTIEELIEKSRQAMCLAKERGRANYRYYSEEMDLVLPNEALMESHLRCAIEFDELTVFFQPQVELETGNSVSFEALLRWNNRKFGQVSPAKFIPLAESSGIINEIGDWVIDQVCQRLKEWQDKQYQPVKVAINISSNQFKSENFSRDLLEAVHRYSLQPNCIEIEITETALMRPEETLKALRQLKEMGFTISIDDFGTGYSSLSYLKKYPIDIIKIDRSFIQDIETDKRDEAIAKTIINLAHSLGMKVIAEGIETDTQAQMMKDSKCHIVQGFLYSQAVPAHIIEQKYLQLTL